MRVTVFALAVALTVLVSTRDAAAKVAMAWSTSLPTVAVSSSHDSIIDSLGSTYSRW